MQLNSTEETSQELEASHLTVFEDPGHSISHYIYIYIAHENIPVWQSLVRADLLNFILLFLFERKLPATAHNVEFDQRLVYKEEVDENELQSIFDAAGSS